MQKEKKDLGEKLTRLMKCFSDERTRENYQVQSQIEGAGTEQGEKPEEGGGGEGESSQHDFHPI